MNDSIGAASAGGDGRPLMPFKVDQKWDARFLAGYPTAQQLQELGGYSIDGSDQFVDDYSQLRVYCPPPELLQRAGRGSAEVNWNLTDGFESFIAKDESVTEHLDTLLRWLQLRRLLPAADVTGDVTDNSAAAASGAQKTQTGPFAEPLNVDLICWRSLLTKFLIAPYESRLGKRARPWKIVVCRHRGILYGTDCFNFTDELPDPRQLYKGFKFETLLTADKKGDVPDTAAPVNNHRAFLSVVKSRLGDHTFVFASDIDALSGDDGGYVELKSTMSSLQAYNFKRLTMLRWWAQCVLNATSKIVCGFQLKDNNNIVRQLREYTVSQLVKLAAEVPDSWNPDVCFNCCNAFIQHIKQTVQLDYNQAVYMFVFNPAVNPGKILCHVEAPDSRYAFLPSWFTGDTRNCRQT